MLGVRAGVVTVDTNYYHSVYRCGVFTLCDNDKPEAVLLKKKNSGNSELNEFGLQKGIGGDRKPPSVCAASPLGRCT